jgi:hypothetical protein
MRWQANRGLRTRNCCVEHFSAELAQGHPERLGRATLMPVKIATAPRS